MSEGGDTLKYNVGAFIVKTQFVPTLYARARSRRFPRARLFFIAMLSERVWRDARDQNVFVSCFSSMNILIGPSVFRIHVAMGRAAAAAGRKQN
jgi:hypothetical protein